LLTPVGGDLNSILPRTTVNEYGGNSIGSALPRFRIVDEGGSFFIGTGFDASLLSIYCADEY
jgi:RPA family protein